MRFAVNGMIRRGMGESEKGVCIHREIGNKAGIGGFELLQKQAFDAAGKDKIAHFLVFARCDAPFQLGEIFDVAAGSVLSHQRKIGGRVE